MVRGNFESPSFPILIVTYNRADTFSRLLSTLTIEGKRELFVFCDGPRNKADEAEQEQIFSAARRCESVSMKRSKRNMGCKRAVEAGIDWVLNQREAVIVLEDDLLPHADFLPFCDRYLVEFWDDFRVQQVSGSNGLGRLAGLLSGSRAFFSPVPNVSGWATWRSRWQRYRQAGVEDQDLLREKMHERWALYGLRRRWNEIVESARESSEGGLDSWAYPWAAWGIGNGLATIVPPANLVEHHGFDDRATHSREGRFVPSRALPRKVGEPKFERPDFLHEKVVNLLDTTWWVRNHYREMIAKRLGKILSTRKLDLR